MYKHSARQEVPLRFSFAQIGIISFDLFNKLSSLETIETIQKDVAMNDAKSLTPHEMELQISYCFCAKDRHQVFFV